MEKGSGPNIQLGRLVDRVEELTEMVEFIGDWLLNAGGIILFRLIESGPLHENYFSAMKTTRI
jgi:hypothetical protein